MYWIEKDENSNFYDVKTEINGVTHNIGSIEKPYSFDDMFLAIGFDNSTLKYTENSFIFRDFEAAKNKVIECWEREVVKKG
jgi:hypothetical protein